MLLFNGNRLIPDYNFEFKNEKYKYGYFINDFKADNKNNNIGFLKEYRK